MLLHSILLSVEPERNRLILLTHEFKGNFLRFFISQMLSSKVFVFIVIPFVEITNLLINCINRLNGSTIK